ncbi:MAG TPA: WD40 repeat domain-containing protein [Anaeromyxobacter sp.]
MRTEGIAALAAAAALVACGSSGKGGAADAPPSSPAVAFGSRGPWPVSNVTYGSADGIRESPVVGFTSDESQNRWVATPFALYLLKPGQISFRRYDASDGLHLDANPVEYCDDAPMAPGARCSGALSSGAGHAITRIVGGGANEVFVGYRGTDPDPAIQCAPKSPQSEGGEDYCDPARHTGKLDRVRVGEDGRLAVDRMDLLANREGGGYWYDRTVQSLAFDHFAHPHTLYAGTNHGVAIVFPDRYRLPRPGEWFDLAYVEWMGDHLHARVCDPGPCPTTSEGPQRMGDWAGLAIDASGDLWHAGRWTAGLITWVSDPGEWFGRTGRAFKVAFGDPYPQAPDADGFRNEPVFPVAREGDSPHLTGAAVCPDGRVWFSSSGPQSGTGDTVAVWNGKSFRTFAATALGLGGSAVRDLACLPDGRVVLAGTSSGVVLHDPAKKTSTPVPGLPSGTITRVEVDRMVSPPTLHVSTDAGAVAIRVLP